MSSIKESLPAVRKANTPISEDWCHAKAEELVFTCIFTIDHFSLRCETNEEYIESSIFPADASNDVPKWSIRAFPRQEDYCGNCLSLSIVSHNESIVNASFKCAILNDKKDETKAVKSIRSFCTKGVCAIFDSVIDRSNLLNTAALLPQDTLTILCEVSVINTSVISGQSKIGQFKVPDSNLSEDFGTLLDNDKFSDVKLVASGHELKAHKNILAARSKVFAAMFEHKMEEHNLNRVNITDIDHEVLKEMLRYIYTDKVHSLDTLAEDLLVASDKYALENLKLMCEESLRTNINLAKAASTLILADRHNAKHLKSVAINFIIRNASDVIETQGWKDMTTTHPYLMAEIFSLMVTKQMQLIAPTCMKTNT